MAWREMTNGEIVKVFQVIDNPKHWNYVIIQKTIVSFFDKELKVKDGVLWVKEE